MVENGYVYAITGGFSTLGYVSLMVVLRFFEERTILLFALFVELVISIGLFILMDIVTFRVNWFIPVGVVGLVVFSLVLSYIMASSSSILAKSSLPEHQSAIQGVRVGMEKLTIVVSNLFAGQIYPLTNSYQLCFIFPTIFLSMACASVVLSWKFMHPGILIQISLSRKGWDICAIRIS